MRAIKLVFAAVVVGVFLLPAALGGCAAPAPYRVWTHPVYQRGQSELQWFADGSDLLIVAENSTDRPAKFTVACVGGGSRWEVDVPAHGSKSGFGQVMNRDVHARPCWVEKIEAGR